MPKSVKELEAENAELKKRIEILEDENIRFVRVGETVDEFRMRFNELNSTLQFYLLQLQVQQQQHAGVIAQKDALIARLRGQLQQAQMINAGLADQLRHVHPALNETLLRHEAGSQPPPQIPQATRQHRCLYRGRSQSGQNPYGPSPQNR